ncbi:MAG: DUF4350 domain-containing protein [Acidobacteriota bacterium]
MSSDARSRWLILLGVLVASALSVGWFLTRYERVEIERRTGASREVRTNRYFALERYLTDSGIELESISTLARLPPADGLLFLPAASARLTPGQVDRVLAWVSDGGTLVVSPSLRPAFTMDDDGLAPDGMVPDPLDSLLPFLGLDVVVGDEDELDWEEVEDGPDADETEEDDEEIGEEETSEDEPSASSSEKDEDEDDDSSADDSTDTTDDEDAGEDSNAEGEGDDDTGDDRSDEDDHAAGAGLFSLLFAERFHRVELEPGLTILARHPVRLESLEFAETLATLDDVSGQSFFLELGWGEGVVRVLADTAFLENDQLADHDDAILAWRALVGAEPPTTAWLAPYLRRASIWGLFAEKGPELCLSLGLFLLTAGLYSAVRFGPLLPPAASPRRELVEHLRASGALLVRAGRLDLLHAAVRAACQRRVRDHHPDSLQQWARSSRLEPDQLKGLLSDRPPTRREAFTRAITLLERVRRSR